MSVQVYKSFSGNYSENIISVNETDYQISTMKRSGNKISCVAMAGTLEEKEDSKIFHFSSDSEKIVLLICPNGTRATKKNIALAQEEGIRFFNELKEKKELGAFEKSEILT